MYRRAADLALPYARAMLALDFDSAQVDGELAPEAIFVRDTRLTPSLRQTMCVVRERAGRHNPT